MRRATPPESDPRFTRPPDETYAGVGDVPDDRAEYARHQLVNNAITSELIDRITGRGDFGETIYGTRPRNQCFAGALSGQYEFREAQIDDDTFGDIAEDVAPFTAGVRFRVPADFDDITIEVSPSAVGYQRRFPTLEEQQNRAQDNEQANVLHDTGTGTATGDGNDDTEGDGADGTEAADPQDSEGEEQTGQTLLKVYERVDFDWPTVTLTADDVENLLDGERPERHVLDTNTAQTAAANVPRQYRARSGDISASEALSVPREALERPDAFDAFLDDTHGGATLEPLWRARLELNARLDGEYVLITARLVNTHGEDLTADVRGTEEEPEDPEYEKWRSTLFDVEVATRVDGVELAYFESQEIEDEYQYDDRIHGIGENCSVEPIFPAEVEPGRNADPVGVRTETVPTYRQNRYLTRDAADLLAETEVLTGEMGEEVLFDTLETIADAMDEAVEDYEAIREEMVGNKTNDAAEEFDTDVEAFKRERERFEAGIACLRRDERALEAFQLMNSAFRDYGIPSWRLFQIVFILMNIPDMLRQAAAVDDGVSVDFDDPIITEDLDRAEVIYFPTGGGKTEAYLGLVIFTAFHDRLRGKTHGTTAMAKFPLRFLSLQQLQRLARVLAKAELLRMDHPEASDGDPFSVGYLVGSQNTPNRFIEDGRYWLNEANDNPEFQSDVQYIDECPFCGNATAIEGDKVRGRIQHVCTADAADCEWVASHDQEPAPLPLYVTDREVYRFAPTFVVSTIDKIAIVGMQRRMRTLFGQTRMECDLHGYSGESGCIADMRPLNTEGDCTEEGNNVESNRHYEPAEEVSPPSLLIQDELHLLREEFGAFDSHYETFLQEHYDRITDGEWESKVVAATATIEGAERQVRALYQKETNVFPEAAPRLRQSFYAFAHPVRTQRTMVGALPRSQSRTYAIEKVHETYAKIVQEYREDPVELYEALDEVEDSYDRDDAQLPIDSEARAEVLRGVLNDYEVQTSYHYSKDNTDMMSRVVRDMINDHLRSDENHYPLNYQLLTGETSLGDVKSAMDRVERIGDDEHDDLHVLIATSMISHGVDLDELNFIGFFGLPRETAEYIQSYSRVGRKWPGTVFMLHNPMRTRDRTYYNRFQYHQAYQDLLVEATPLERYAEFAIECTMPGLFGAALVQYFDYLTEEEPGNRVYMFDGFNEAAEEGDLDYDQFLAFIERAYGLHDPLRGSDDSGTAGAPSDENSGIAIYRENVADHFQTVWDAAANDENRVPDAVANNPDLDDNNFIPTDVLERDSDARKAMTHLREIDEQLDITLDNDTNRIINEYKE